MKFNKELEFKGTKLKLNNTMTSEKFKEKNSTISLPEERLEE